MGKIEAAYTHSSIIKSLDGLEVGEKKPIIVFSHGYQFDPSEYRPLIEQLTSQGFVCLVLDHPANSASGRFGPQLDVGEEFISRGVSAPEESRMEVRSHMQTDDILGVVREIRMPGSSLHALSGIADTDSVILMGHSLGGGASVDAARRDTSIKGVINLDGALRGDKARDALSVPALTLISGRKYSSPSPTNIIEELIAIENESMKADWEVFSTVSKEKTSKTRISYIHEADHMDFSIAPFLQWRDGLLDSLADCKTTHQITREEVLDFIESLNE